MNTVSKNEMLFEKVTKTKPLIDYETGIRKSESFTPASLDYTVDEMLTQVEFDIPVQREQKDKLDNERVLLK